MAEINKEEKPKAKIIAFPRSLRLKADEKMPHICFSLTGNQAKEIGGEAERIHLYTPSGFQVSDGANFNGIEIGTVAAAKQVAENVKAKRNAKAGFTKTDNTVIGLKAIEGLGADAGQVGVAAMQQGVAFNPQTSLAFDGVNLRTFSFAFTLVPESKEEAEDSRRIENFFRKYMYPEKKGQISLVYPPKFKIQFFIGEKENIYMPMLHDCYLAGVESTFNPDSNAFFVDGQPTAVSLTLNFSEVRMLTRHDVYKESQSSDDPSYDYSRPGSQIGE